MNNLNILISGNNKKEEIKSEIEKLKLKFNLDLFINDVSELSDIQNIEHYYSLINNIQYFNAFILNYKAKEDIFKFFKSFNSENWGITNECYPFFLICNQILSKKEAKNFIDDLNKSKEDEYKIKFGNILFFNEIQKEKEKEEFQIVILNIYNCYFQKALTIHENQEDTINILVIGIKNSGKSFLINRLLWETRALSMENHYTTKLNSYKHKKYPIVFYDISGFNENEDDELINVNSKIDEFNKDYNNIKNKIHAILYVIDCNSVRILQKKEKELIQNIFNINIPIFIVGQKAKKSNITNFIRKIKFEISTLSTEYKEKIEIQNNRIFCLDSSKKSVSTLLQAVYHEFLNSKKINLDIINSFSNLNNKKMKRENSSDKISISDYDDEEIKFIDIIFSLTKKSIFFNNFIEKIKELYNEVFKIKNKYKKEKFWFRSLNEEKIKKINMEIEDEIIKIFDKNILKKINSIIDEQQKDLIIMSKNKIGGMTTHFLGSGIEFLCIVGLGIGLSHFCFIGFTLYFILEFGFYKKRDEKTKEIIDQNIKKFLYKMEQKYIFLNLLLIREMAEGYNKSIDEFNKYINEFETEEYIE